MDSVRSAAGFAPVDCAIAAPAAARTQIIKQAVFSFMLIADPQGDL